MEGKTKLIVVAGPKDLVRAGDAGYPVGHLLYSVSRDGTLLTADKDASSGALMVLDLSRYGGADPAAAAAEVTFVLDSRGYRALLVDPGTGASRPVLRLSALLCQTCRRLAIPFYTYSPVQKVCPGAVTVLSSALSGGTLEGHLAAGQKRYGALALEVEPCRHDFSLPDRSGQGRSLSRQELDRLLEQHRPRCFFSPELCVNYFTYRSGRSAHMVLYDTAGTIAQKLKTASSAGIETAFVYYGAVEGCISHLADLYPPG